MSGPPPDCALVVNQPPLPGIPRLLCQPQRPQYISPILPSSMNFFASFEASEKRLFLIIMSVLPAAFAASFIFMTSSTLTASGFSQKTCLPALNAATAIIE